MPKGGGQKTVHEAMHKFKAGTLHSGKPGPGKGPKVASRKQAIAIAMSESGLARKKPAQASS